MMQLFLAAVFLSQAVQGLVPDVGASVGTASDHSMARKLLGGRDLLQCNGKWGQCGGKSWNGSKCCEGDNSCIYKHEWYSQCLPGGGSGALKNLQKDSNFVEESTSPCGAGGAPVCTGSALAARNPQYECDYGFVGGPGGICVPYTPMSNPSPNPSPPSPSPSPPGPSGNGGGEFSVCVPGESRKWGPSIDEREFRKQGSAVTVTKSGECSWEEFAGGFDGFPSPKIGDGHEEGMDMAIERMFPGQYDKQNKFLQKMIEMAKPVDLDFPQDQQKADDGMRMDNIHKLNWACSQLISVSC